MKIIERYKEWSKKADEKNVKDWQKHPKLNKGLIIIISCIIVSFATIVLGNVLLGYISEYSILALICSAFMYLQVSWLLRYGKEIERKAFPKV